MALLIFEHEGCTVMTTAWTASSRNGKKVTICYEWGADRIGWLSNSVSTARVSFDWDMKAFIAAAKRGGPIDLRQSGGGND